MPPAVHLYISHKYINSTRFHWKNHTWIEQQAIKSNLINRKLKMNLKYPIMLCPLILGIVFLSHQSKVTLAQDTQRTTLVVSQNPNGAGIQVMDPNNNNRQLINTNSQQQLELEGQTGDEDASEEQVVRGLLEWLEEKKRKKKENKKRRPLPIIQPILPMPLPLPPPLPHERPREIHIHINNHIKKKEHHKKPHKKHGHYEDYHDGHYDHDYHDKHYSGKHSWPLLGHHLNWDHFGGHDHHGGDHHGGYDDYGGHESAKIEKSIKLPRSSLEQRQQQPRQDRSAKLVATSGPIISITTTTTTTTRRPNRRLFAG